MFLSLACNCNPEGSLNVSCNEYGECNCKFGVLGIKCDSCQENKHNLTAGCVSKYCYKTDIIILTQWPGYHHTTPEEFENGALFLRIIDLPSTLIR